MELEEFPSALHGARSTKQGFNVANKTTWEDGRNRHRYHVPSGEFIPLQHGSPDMRRNSIYPSHPSPIPAFQMPAQYSPKYIPLQEYKSGSHTSPLSIRTTRVHDSTTLLHQDPDESLMKISSMFPTVSDTHIRLLLRKYHNREAVVISALQVEKHPIVTLGPVATPPPAARSIHIPLQQMSNSRTSSPTIRTTSTTNSTYNGSPRVGDYYRNAPRPQSSPKLKLRYMKSIFPQVEETIILDVLASNENNIQKASDSLQELGFSRKESKGAKKHAEEQFRNVHEEKRRAETHFAPIQAAEPPKLKSTQEKEETKATLQQAYSDMPEHVISIALESVHFDEDRANQILKIMVQEDNKMKEKAEESAAPDVVDNLVLPTSVTTSQSRQSLKSLLKEKPESNKSAFSRVIGEFNMNGYKSSHLSNTNGSNPQYVSGANEKLLLEDYVKWQGANPKCKHGANTALVNGPNKELLLKRNANILGPNPQYRKGALFGLAQGSIFAQLKVVRHGEPRGK